MDGPTSPKVLFLSDTSCRREGQGNGFAHAWAWESEPTVTVFGPNHPAYQPGMDVGQALRLLYGDRGPDILLYDAPPGRWVVEGLESVDISKGMIVTDSWNDRLALTETIRQAGFDFALATDEHQAHRLRREIAGLETFWLSHDRLHADFLAIMRQVHEKRQPSPRRRVKLVIGALSAQVYEHRRQACLDTWAGQRDEEVETVFLVGNGPSNLPVREGHLLRCPCADDYLSLPQKTRWFCLWALLNYDFDYLFKCDDDTYVDIDRLLRCGATADYVGYDIAGFASGGAGYLLSRRAAITVAARMVEGTGPEDVLVQKALAQAGIPFTPDSRFYAWNDRAPTSDNDLMTCHYCGPDLMPKVHQTALAHRPPDSRPSARIPRVLHQIWLDDQPMSSHVRYLQQTWKRHHPSWDFRLWNAANLFPLANQAQFNRATDPTERLEIARYEILERFGGVCVDVGFECLQPIDDLLHGIDGFAAEEDDDLIATGILGAAANQSLLREMIETIPSLLAEEENRGVTAIRSRFNRLVRDRQDMHLFSREFFYPIDSTGTIWTPLSLAYAVPHRAHLVKQRKAVRHYEIDCS